MVMAKAHCNHRILLASQHLNKASPRFALSGWHIRDCEDLSQNKLKKIIKQKITKFLTLIPFEIIILWG